MESYIFSSNLSHWVCLQVCMSKKNKVERNHWLHFCRIYLMSTWQNTQSVGISQTFPKTALSNTGKQPEAKAIDSNIFRKNSLSNLWREDFLSRMSQYTFIYLTNIKRKDSPSYTVIKYQHSTLVRMSALY